MARFTVVTVVKEDPSVILRFARHYARLGAERVLIHHDGPLDPAAARALGPDAFGDDRIRLIVCDDAWWSRIEGGRPGVMNRRNTDIFTRLHRSGDWPGDWLLVCDADEFVIADGPLGPLLDLAPPEVDSILVPSAEAIWGPGEDIEAEFGSSWFRRPFPSDEAWERERRAFYGPIGRLFGRGLSGHPTGKSLTRRGAPVDRINLHWAARGGASISIPAAEAHPGLAGLELAHFDAISMARWRRKFARRAKRFGQEGGTGSPRRQRQRTLINVATRLGRPFDRWLFRSIYVLDRRRLDQLAARGLAFRRDIFA